jgi:hypothetical protein
MEGIGENPHPCKNRKGWATRNHPSDLRLRHPPGFWQARFYDFNVYSDEKKNEKLDYMHANPANRGLVRHPQDWPWSSWSFYFGSESGLIAMDPVNM